jgi:uncharacterized membrane protein
MDGFLVLLGLAALLAFLLGPIAFFMAVGHRRQLRELRSALAEFSVRLAAIEARPASAAVATPASQLASAPEPETAPFEDASALETPTAELVGMVEEVAPARVAEPADGVVEPVLAESRPEAPKARASRSLEESLGARWTVWVGGIAMALGALLLVRYSIEQGYFGPGARISLGLLFAAALLGAGERLRRAEAANPDAPQLATARASAPAVLTGAGIVAAFGSVYAAHALYGFLAAAPAFLALGLVGLVAIAYAALHGPGLAALGLVGSLATPLLVTSEHPSPWPVVVYLFVVGAATYGMARLRRWLWLALSAAAGGLLWTALLFANSVGSGSLDGFHAALAALVTQGALAALFVALAPYRGEADETASFDVSATATLAIFSLVSAGLFARPDGLATFDAPWIVAAAAWVAILALSGYFVASVASASALAGLVTLAVMGLWPAADTAQSFDLAGVIAHWRWPPPENPQAFAGFAIIAGLGVGALAGWRLFNGPRLPLVASALYAGAAALTPLGALLVTALRFSEGRPTPALAVVAVLLAALFALGARAFQRRLNVQASEAIRLGLGALAAGAIGALTSGLAIALDGGALTVSIALAAAGTAYVSARLDLPALRWCVAGLGVLVAARLAYEPRIVGAALSPTPIFNWLLFGYGAPALGFGAAARWMRPRGEDTPVRIADALTLLFSALLVFFEIRHFINHGDPFARGSGLVEQALMAVSAFGFAIVQARLHAARRNVVFRWGALAAGTIGAAVSAFGLLIAYNPFLNFKPGEGGVFINALLLAYLLPALLAGALSFSARGPFPRWYARMAGWLSAALGVAYVVLQLRVLLHGQSISWVEGFTLSELGLEAALCLAVALVVTLVTEGGRRARRLVAVSFWASSALGIAGLCGLVNPLWTDDAIAGGVAINALLVAYALPAALAAGLARRWGGNAVGWAAVLWLFAYVTLETRRVFQGPNIGLARNFIAGEFYAYSAVWLALGLALLAYGVRRQSPQLRYASAFFVVATTLKVFLLDFSGLEGMYRALSFIGLGIALMGIGLVYQKLVFATRPGTPGSPTGG